jgi:putative peptidoglycan lipid II flippase
MDSPDTVAERAELGHARQLKYTVSNTFVRKMIFSRYFRNTYTQAMFSDIAIGAAALAAIKILKAALSVVVFIVSAAYFGLSKERDFWVLSSAFVLSLSQLVFGPVYEIYRVRLAHDIAKRGLLPASHSACGLNTVVLMASALLTALGFAFSRMSSGFMAPGFSDLQVASLAEMFMWIIPSLMLYQSIMSFSAMLNALGWYYIPEITLIVSSTISLAFVFFGNDAFGIYSLVWGTYAGQLLTSGVLLWALRRRLNGRFRIITKPDSTSWHYVAQAFPFWFSYIAGQILVYVERALSSYLPEGYISLFDYARKLVEMPMGLIMGVATSFFSVKLTNAFITGGFVESNILVQNFFRYLIYAITPLVVMFMCCAGPLYHLLFFSSASQLSIQSQFQSVMIAFSISLPALCLYVVANQSLIVIGKARWAAGLSTGFILAIAIADAVGFDAGGIVWLSICWSVGVLISGSVQMWVLLKDFSGRKRWDIFIVLGALTLISSACYSLTKILPYTPANTNNIWYSLSYIAIFLSLVGLLLPAIIWVFNLPEKRHLINTFRYMARLNGN